MWGIKNGEYILCFNESDELSDGCSLLKYGNMLQFLKTSRSFDCVHHHHHHHRLKSSTSTLWMSLMQNVPCQHASLHPPDVWCLCSARSLPDVLWPSSNNQLEKLPQTNSDHFITRVRFRLAWRLKAEGTCWSGSVQWLQNQPNGRTANQRS